MVKDIVVNLNVGTEANWAGDYAISVAAAFDAHLTGVVFLYGPIVPVSRAGYVPPEVEVIERHNQAVLEATRERFAAAGARGGIKAETLTLSASLVSAGDQFGKIARRFHLAVVGRMTNATIEALSAINVGVINEEGCLKAEEFVRVAKSQHI